jgi:MtfA peptidase
MQEEEFAVLSIILMIVAILLLIALAVLGSVLVFGSAFYIVRNTIDRNFRHVINRHFIIRELRPIYRIVIEKHFLFYHRLTDKNKKLFEKRVQKFIDKKKFIPQGGLEKITPEMEALVASCAVQITWGLPGVYFEHFDEIHLYPDFYFSEGMMQFNAGEVHKSGLIKFSWHDFVSGYVNHQDARNTGLHEMAHALRLENVIKNREYNYFHWDYIHKLNHYTVMETTKIQQGHPTIFREYAATNYHEFFAVLIEVFFEQPDQLKEYHPELFRVTTKLLRQDPKNPNQRIR